MNMMMGNAYEKYRHQGIMTASPADLVVMLYDGCIKQLKMTRIAIEEKHYEQANGYNKRAQDIVMELIMSLDLSFPISKDLMNIYEFVLQEMVQVNIDKDSSRIQPLLELLESLREAWAEIRKQRGPTLELCED